jgi:dihydropyrimidinase
MDLVIKNGTVVTESASIRADVGIRGGKIVAIAEKMERGGKSIDAAGKYVFPSGVEIHTHIDAVLFGMRTVDDWYVSSLGAAFGGTATIVDYIMQGPNQSLRETINEYSERARGKSIVDYAFSPIINQFTEETYREIPVLILT